MPTRSGRTTELLDNARELWFHHETTAREVRLSMVQEPGVLRDEEVESTMSQGQSVDAPPGWLTVSQTAEILELDRRTVRRKAEAGRFRGAIKERVGSALGWRWLIPERAVQKVQEQQGAPKRGR
jgi:hypothetical protein